ncbi:Flagellar biosynthetic protein FliP precursor [Aureliella helgolandensis]|uniref:Flagellar biosynthetic protein FliP n=2 Tax=Aureliella helgolandensis TaxID=2527968 RepID=A0A518GGN0_9BACT|nr:Flagellar biosynthetic protein FliP precursor [Aureliella helgolandensis]
MDNLSSWLAPALRSSISVRFSASPALPENPLSCNPCLSHTLGEAEAPLACVARQNLKREFVGSGGDLGDWSRARMSRVALAACLFATLLLAQVQPVAAQNTFEQPAASGSQLSPSGSLFDRMTEAVQGDSVAGGLGEGASATAENFLLSGPEKWTSRDGLTSSLQIILLLTVLSLAPAILLMTTCYVRIIVVMGLLRQALGTGQLPPSQVITSISLFMTMFIMAPVWNEVYDKSIAPYTAPGSDMSVQAAWEAGITPVRTFMIRQIDMAGNDDDVLLFHNYNDPSGTLPESMEEFPLRVLLPAYMLSELKTAFLMGFQIFLPFLLIDLVVASVTISMGMMMLPPAMISLPFKLLLFVLIDGWHLVVEMLLSSFGTLA